MKNKILLILILIPNILPAQIQNKLEYIYTKPSLAGAAILSAVFYQDFDIKSSIKIRRTDDSLEADNDIELELNNQEVTFFDITGMQIRDSLHTRFFGTFHVRNYDLTPEEKNKK